MSLQRDFEGFCTLIQGCPAQLVRLIYPNLPEIEPSSSKT